MALERAVDVPVEICRARNGEEAVELIKELSPDLLLLDLKMPGMAGHEVLEEIKGDDRLRSIPVAVLTSSDRDEDVAKSYGPGWQPLHHQASESCGAREEARRPAQEPDRA